MQRPLRLWQTKHTKKIYHITISSTFCRYASEVMSLFECLLLPLCCSTVFNSSKVVLDLGLPCIESHLCWQWRHQPAWVDRQDISQAPEVVLDDMQTHRVCCCFHETQPHSCTWQCSYVRSTVAVSREPASKSHYDAFTGGMRFRSRLGLEKV